MKANEAGSSSQKQGVSRQSHAAQFIRVLDGRKQPIRGLWQRNDRFYARLAVENPVTGVKKTKRVPLVNKDGEPVRTAAEAKAELARLQTQRADNALPVLGRQKKFADYVTTYLDSTSGSKKAGTTEKEKAILGRWSEKIGQLRLDQIKRVHVNRFIEARLKERDENDNPKVSARTINLDVIALRVVMKKALSEGLIQRLPTEGLQPLKTTQAKRPLFSAADLDKLCKAAFETKRDKKGRVAPLTENAQELVDYIKVMAFCGARRNEALGLQWKDIDADNGLLHIRRQITHRGIEDLKNKQQRAVDFNPKLKAHLAEMKERCQGVSEWLFPSPQRGDKDIPAKTFKQSIWMVRERAGMPSFGFHDLRHHFISMCVMSGIDYMTIAAWVGHQDGGILIGKVYGHLANEHRKQMAEKLNFGPVIVAPAATA